MKLFGEYLIEKQVITEEALTRALVDQLKTMPSIGEVVFEKKLMAPKDLLSIFREQNASRAGFIESARKLSLWSGNVESEVERSLAAQRIPLGQLLVKSGAASLEDITHALDDFLADAEKPAERVAAPAPKAAEPQSTAAASPGVGGLSFYTDLLTPACRAEVERPFTAGASGLPDVTALQTAADTVHRLKGAARLAGVGQSEKFLSVVEGVIRETLKRDLAGVNQDLSKKLETCTKEVLEILWLISSSLCQGISETQAIASGDLGKKIQPALDGLEVLLFDLSFVAEKKT